MAGQTYQVNYIVNVDAANAQSAINAFKRAVSSMDKATKPIIDLQNKVRGLVETMSALNRGKYSVKIDTKPATQKIGKLIRALQMAKAEVQQLNAMGVTLGGTGNKAKATSRTTATSTTAGFVQRTRTAPSSTSSSSKRYYPSAIKHPTNLGYKIWGPTPLPNNGGMAIDMMKGMGVAYGLAGAGMMVSNIVDQAAEYDNLMKTVENILKSHDTKGDFSSRFSSMTTTVRNVGMETKFKVTEVADAAKFLAMAGLNVEAISQAIRPIADIALVGDTELGETADLVTNIMTAYNIAPSKMRNAADVMTNTFTMSNTTLTEIAESYKYAASLLSAGGVPFEEATAAIGVLGDAGIKGSQAGTTLRTIIANIVNPTKKQQSAWDEIGVSRYNNDGSRKSVLEIFQALNKANLGVDAYYRLFHKTAASGAVALASHVDKWEDVYLENFLANGLSAHLADEKKNTLQGLWAQLESVFIDKGVTAFNGIQGELRNIMSSAIAWLKTDEATKKFKEISKAIMEFVRVIIQASKYFAQLFDVFGAWMKAWMKFQLMIWPVVKAVTAFRSIFLGLMGLRKVGFMIMGLSQSFRALGAAATFAGRSIAGSAVAGTAGTTTGITRVAGPIGFLPGLTATQMNWARSGMPIGLPGKSLNIFGWKKIPLGYKTKGIDISRPVYDRGSYDIVARHQENRKRLLQYQKNMRAYNRRLALHQGINGAGNIAGMFGVGYGMKTIADSNNGYDTAAGGLFAAAGTAAMMGGPWGWGIGAGLAIVGGIMKVIGSAQQSNKIYGELQVFAKNNAINSGIIADSESQTMKYLEVQHTKYYDINQLIQKRIDLTAQLLGLQNGDNPMDASVGVFQGLMEKYKDLWDRDNLKAFNDIYRDKFNTDKHLVQYGSGYYLTSADRLVNSVVGADGKRIYKIQGANGEEAIRVGNGTTNGLKAAFASMAATAEVMAPGGYYEKLVEGVRLNAAKYGLKNASRAEFDEYVDQIIKANNPKYLTDLVGLEEIKDTDWDLNRMLRDEQTRIYMWTQLEALITPMRQAFNNFKSELESGNLSSDTLTNYLQYVIGNQAGAALKDYDPNNISGWYSHFGYENGTFNGFTTVDKNGVVRAYTAEEAAKIAASDMQSVIDVIKQLRLESNPAAEVLQTSANTLLALAQSFLGLNNSIPESAGNKIANPNAPDISNGTGNGRGDKSSDYKSHQKERAIPKQININIQNLMNVDSIDLTNENNVAIIDKIKREVAYALYEAAADGTMMLNGLANT